MGNTIVNVTGVFGPQNAAAATSSTAISSSSSTPTTGVELDLGKDPISRYENVRVYAQCAKGGKGKGLTVLFINLDDAATYNVMSITPRNADAGTDRPTNRPTDRPTNQVK
jgi:hypothetical protein